MKLHMCGYPNPVPIQMITTHYTHLTIQCPNHSNLEPKMLHFDDFFYFASPPPTLRGKNLYKLTRDIIVSYKNLKTK